MDTLVIRQKLYDYIKEAGDEEVEAMYDAIKDQVSEPYVWYKDEELIAELERRSDDLQTGKDKGVPWDDVKDRLLKRTKKKIYKVIFSSVAEYELQGAFDWYESCLVGLGERFVGDIDKAMNVLAIHPQAFPAKKARFHELVIADFPYIIVYEILREQGIINILHVFHTSRNPKLKYKK